MKHSDCGPSQLQKASLCSAAPFEESLLRPDIDTEESRDGTKQHKIMDSLIRGKMVIQEVPEKYEANIRAAIEMFLEASQDTLLDNGQTQGGGSWFSEMQLPCVSTSVLGHIEVGTIDLHIVYPEQKRIALFDWKFGGSLVHHPMWNMQLQDYASSLWDKYGFDFSIEVAYIQPQAREKYNMQPWVFEPGDRLAIVERIRSIREKVYGCEIEYSVGPACQFCKAKLAGTCWARQSWPSQFFAGDPVSDEKIMRMDPNELGRTLDIVRCVSVEAKRITNVIRERLRNEEIVVDHWAFDRKSDRITVKADYAGRVTRPIKICRKLQRTIANE